jgi:hypothetical protein
VIQQKNLSYRKRDYSPEIARWNSYQSPVVSIAEAFAEQGFRLHWYQKLLFALIDRYPRCCVVASRQLGKSETICRYALAYALAVPNQLILIVSGGARQAKEILKRIKRTIKNCPIKIGLETANSTEVELFTGSRIISLPNNPDTVRGYPANFLFVDELDSIWDFLEFKAALFPSVSRVEGRIVVSGTFKGKKQLYETYAGPNGKPEKAWPSVVLPVWVNPPPDIEQQEHDLPPSIFAQEFECVPFDAAGTLFPYEMFDSCIPRTSEGIAVIDHLDRSVLKDALYYGGWDPAKLVDGSIFSGLELPANSRKLRLRTIENYSGMDYTTQAKEIGGLHRLFHYWKIKMDQTGVGEGPLELLENEIGSHCEGVHFSRNIKEQLINDVRIAFQDREIEVPSHETLRKELHDLDPKTLDHRPGGGSDHVWSLALAWSAYEDMARLPQLRLSSNQSHEVNDLDY